MAQRRRSQYQPLCRLTGKGNLQIAEHCFLELANSFLKIAALGEQVKVNALCNVLITARTISKAPERVLFSAAGTGERWYAD